MIELAGYKIINEIHHGKQYKVYRAIKLSTQQSVVIKAPLATINDSDLNTKEIASLKFEFSIVQQIDSPFVIKFLELQPNETYGYILIEEDHDFSALSEHIPKNGMELLTFLNIAIEIAKGLEAIHGSGIAHKAIKPSNILFNPETRCIKFIDFKSSSFFQFQKHVEQIDYSEESLVYLAPEQIGRFNRRVDYRADFYSLGVTLYELLCGEPPFVAKNILEILHCHIARQPLPPHEKKSNVPLVISNIIMKLLSKDANNRYQNAQTLINDLNKCLDHFQEMVYEIEKFNFELGQNDFTLGLYFPEKLYGREKQIEILQDTFNKAREGKIEIYMITGSAGIGKSVLVNELRPYIELKKGVLLCGKFDQLNQNLAYTAIKQSFQTWVKYILTQNDNAIEMWKNKLLFGLGNNVQVIIEIIPELALIAGKQPPLPVLGLEQTKNRFHITFQKFIKILAAPEHPLVLFLDDLQWADRTSINLMKSIVADTTIQGFLYIGAYRDNEVGEDHPFIRSLSEISRTNINIGYLKLENLNDEQVTQWVADTINAERNDVLLLAQLIKQKTDGNPFFMKTFMQCLHEAKLLTVNKTLGWQWDIEKIRQYPATENVIILMVHKIMQLPESQQTLLKTAACLGNRFTEEDLQLITQQHQPKLLTDLMNLTESGLIIQNGDFFVFAHDRIQEASYNIIGEKACTELHLSIARALKTNLSQQAIENKLSEIADHYNKGQELITDAAEKFELAKLNIAVGKKFKQKIAYNSALTYLKLAENYLTSIAIWEIDFDLALTLYKELADVEFLIANFESSAKYSRIILDKPLSNIAKAEIYNLLLVQKTLNAEYQEAIEIAYQALNLLGIEIHVDDLKGQLKNTLAEVNKQLTEKNEDELLNPPTMHDLTAKAAMSLLCDVATPAYIINQPLCMLVSAIMINLTLKHGAMEKSALGYSLYALLLNAQFNDINLGYKYSLLAIRLSYKLHDIVNICRTNYVYACYFHHWRKPVHEVEEYLANAEKAGLECGEFQYLGYITQYRATYLFYSGIPLTEIHFKLNELLQVHYIKHNKIVVDVINAFRLVTLNMIGQSKNELSFHDDVKDDNEYQADWLKEKNYYALTNYLIVKARALYIHEHYEQALTCIQSANEYLACIPGHFSVIVHNFYYSLILLSCYDEQEPDVKRQFRQQIETNQAKMLVWAEHCPENFMHLFFLVKAEMENVVNNDISWETIVYYNQALDNAKKCAPAEIQALVYELTGKFFLKRKNNSNCAQGYIFNAYICFLRRGSKRKIDMLIKQYRELLTPLFYLTTNSLPIDTNMSISASSLALVDLSSVIKASQVISSCRDLPTLLQNIIKIIIENAGAQHGALLLEESGDLFVQAEYTGNDSFLILHRLPLANWENGVHAIIEYVHKNHNPILLASAIKDNFFANDPEVKTKQTRSVLCIPIMLHGKNLGILYAENNLIDNIFTEQHRIVLTMLATQMAITMENAKYYQDQIKSAELVAKAQEHRAEEAIIYRDKLQEFIDTVCHELNNPLVGIFGSVEMIEQELAHLVKYAEGISSADQSGYINKIAQIREHMQTITQCADHQKKVVAGTILLSKLNSNHIKFQTIPFQPKNVIETAIKMLTPKITSKPIKFSQKFPEENITVKGDPEHVKIILINLISNAIKFTEQGYISVTMRKENINSNHALLIFSVEDSGVGMTDQDISRLFQKFSRPVSSKYEGFGLGLVITKKIVELMRGTIHVESKSGIGTTFTVKIPFELAQPQHKLSPLLGKYLPVATPDNKIEPKHILIVEDNALNQSILCKQLKNMGHTSDIASNGQIAVDKFKFDHEKYDLILMDMEMPIMNGYMATQRIRYIEKQAGLTPTPIIGLSAYGRKEYEERAKEAGMNDYITKPYELKVISDKIIFWTTLNPGKKEAEVESGPTYTTPMP